MTSSKFNGSLEPIRLSEESKNEFGFLQKTWTISVQAFRLGFLFEVLPSDPVIASNVGFYKAFAFDVHKSYHKSATAGCLISSANSVRSIYRCFHRLFGRCPRKQKRRFKVRRHDLDRFKVSGPTNGESSRLYPL